MTDDNGANQALPQKIGTNGRDPVTGKFLKGNSGSRGRPVGTHGLPALIRREVKRRGETVRDVAWELFDVLRKNALAGDTNAAKIALDRLLGVVQPPRDINILNAVGAHAASGATLEPGDLREFIGKLVEVSREQGLIDDGADPVAD